MKAPTIRIALAGTPRLFRHIDCSREPGSIMLVTGRPIGQTILTCGSCSKTGTYPLGESRPLDVAEVQA